MGREGEERDTDGGERKGRKGEIGGDKGRDLKGGRKVDRGLREEGREKAKGEMGDEYEDGGCRWVDGDEPDKREEGGKRRRRDAT